MPTGLWVSVLLWMGSAGAADCARTVEVNPLDASRQQTRISGKKMGLEDGSAIVIREGLARLVWTFEEEGAQPRVVPAATTLFVVTGGEASKLALRSLADTEGVIVPPDEEIRGDLGKTVWSVAFDLSREHAQVLGDQGVQSVRHRIHGHEDTDALDSKTSQRLAAAFSCAVAEMKRGVK